MLLPHLSFPLKQIVPRHLPVPLPVIDRPSSSSSRLLAQRHARLVIAPRLPSPGHGIGLGDPIKACRFVFDGLPATGMAIRPADDAGLALELNWRKHATGTQVRLCLRQLFVIRNFKGGRGGMRRRGTTTTTDNE